MKEGIIQFLILLFPGTRVHYEHLLQHVSSIFLSKTHLLFFQIKSLYFTVEFILSMKISQIEVSRTYVINYIKIQTEVLYRVRFSNTICYITTIIK